MSQAPTSIRQRLGSKQFIVTMTGMFLMTYATVQGVNVVPLSTVIIMAIGGHAGVNAIERRQTNAEAPKV